MAVRTIFLLTVLVLGLAACATPAAEAGNEAPGAAVSEAVVITAKGRFSFTVELARTPAERRRGLQERRHLAADAGMLFEFGSSRTIIMWMKDTYISLDMIFLAADGSVLNIATNTVPHSLARIRSAGPAHAVLEVNAGTAARLGLAPGDRVLHAIFGNAVGQGASRRAKHVPFV